MFTVSSSGYAFKVLTKGFTMSMGTQSSVHNPKGLVAEPIYPETGYEVSL